MKKDTNLIGTLKILTISIISIIFFCTSSCKDKCPGDSKNFIAIKNEFYFHEKSDLWKGYADDSLIINKKTINQYDVENCHRRYFTTIIDGDYTTFEYYYRNEGCELLVDDEYECQFCFKVKISGDKFEINNPRNLNENCIFNESYFGCPECCYQKMIFTKGKIEGNKTEEGAWEIEAKVFYCCVDSLNKYSEPRNIEFAGLFKEHRSDSCVNYLRKKNEKK